MKMKVENVPCGDMHDLMKVVADNVEADIRCFKKLDRKIGRVMGAGFIFGIVVELCFLTQNQKINELEEKLSNMNEEIKELRDKEGD